MSPKMASCKGQHFLSLTVTAEGPKAIALHDCYCPLFAVATPASQSDPMSISSETSNVGLTPSESVIRANRDLTEGISAMSEEILSNFRRDEGEGLGESDVNSSH